MLRNSPKVTHLASGRARFWVGFQEGKVQITVCLMGHAKEIGVYLGNNGNPRKDASQPVTLSYPVESDSSRPHGLWHARPPWPSPSPGACPSSLSLHWWCRPVISSSDTLFSFCPQSFQASGTFPMSWLFLVSRKRLCSQVYVIRIKTVKVFIPFSEVSKGWGCWQD